MSPVHSWLSVMDKHDYPSNMLRGNRTGWNAGVSAMLWRRGRTSRVGTQVQPRS